MSKTRLTHCGNGRRNTSRTDIPWLGGRLCKTKGTEAVFMLHLDLSASRCEGGLGSVASDVTGFGVVGGWGC
jgi:hypothetical protein